MKLWELTAAMAEVQDWVEDNEDALLESGGELPEELAERLGRLEGDLAHKAVQVGKAIRNLRAEAEAAQAEANRLQVMATARKNAWRSLSAYLVHHLRAAGVRRVEDGAFKVRIQRNSAPSVEVAPPAPKGEEELLPKEWLRAHYDLDKTRALEDAEAAGVLPTEPGVPVRWRGAMFTLDEHLRIHS